MATSAPYRELAQDAWTWVLAQVREDDGPWLPEWVDAEHLAAGPAADRDSWYSGIGGLAPVLAEVALHRHLSDDERDLAQAVVRRLRAQVPGCIEPSFFDGLAGHVTALRLLEPDSEAPALRRLAQLATADGWPTTTQVAPGYDGPLTDLSLGSAGVVLAAVWAAGPDWRRVATTGCDALLATADRTPAGLDWGMVPGQRSRGPNYSHGTAGVATALAIAGAGLGRPDLVDAAQQGARHLLSVGSLADGGFVVPHTIPPSTRVVEPVTFTWCHGPAGTSYLFAALAYAGVTEVDGLRVTDLRQRCLQSVLDSGAPRRLRPGFWDNDGRCCGTAGVGDALLDGAADCADPGRSEVLLAGAVTMGDALVERAVRDQDGARWRFLEHRQDPPLLPPGTSWMQGAGGIAAFLFRLARVLDGGPSVPVVDRPDQWWAVPAALRTVHGPHVPDADLRPGRDR